MVVNSRIIVYARPSSTNLGTALKHVIRARRVETMPKEYLPFTAVHTGGAREINFPLHDLTVDAVDVGAMLEALLVSISEQIQLRRNVSDGDVLQAMCMALAIRMHLVEAAPDAVRAMVAATLEQADDAVANSIVLPVGRA
jgi:hypothetical protein